MMDYTDLENKITDKTKAIIGVHLFGTSLDMNRLEYLSEKYNLTLKKEIKAGPYHYALVFIKN